MMLNCSADGSSLVQPASEVGGSTGEPIGGAGPGTTTGTVGNPSTGGRAIGGAKATGGFSPNSTSATCSVPASPGGGSQHCSAYQEGSVNGGYSYTVWSSGSGGCITPYGVGAAFKATWNDSGDFLARVGLKLGNNKPYTQYGTFAADFAETHTGSGGGFSYIGVYGWSTNPLVEYYIVEDWVTTNRPVPGTKTGTITVDGAPYDVYTHTQVNQPAITGGNATFPQIFSVRQTARNCGHISITEHFKAWEPYQKLGSMYEAKILVEVGGGVGSADVTSATLTIQ
jgi:hypothetical protein